MFGPMQFYLVFKTIASIYERLVMAHELITRKVERDLQRDDIKQVIQKSDTEMDVSEATKNEIIKERFKLFICALIGTLS